MNAKEVKGGIGTVIIDVTDEKGDPQTVTFPIVPLTIAENLLLDSEFSAIAVRNRDRAIEEKIQQIGSVERPTWAHQQAVSQLVSRSISEPEDFEIDRVRVKCQGVRIELYHRSKKSKPDLTQAMVNAVVTDENYVGVFKQIAAIVGSETPHKSEPAA